MMNIRVRCLLVCAAVVGCIVAPAASPRDVAAQTGHSSPPQASGSGALPLLQALVKYQDAWRLVLTYDPDLLAEKWTPWTEPQHDNPEDDLRALLQDNDLSFYRLSSGAYAIVKNKTSARRYGSIGGYVLDQTTGEPLPFANVRLELIKPTGQGAATDVRGLFTIPSLVPGEYRAVISYVGYETEYRIVQVRPGEHINLFVDLKKVTRSLLPIIVDGAQEMNTPRVHGTLRGNDLNQVRGVGTPDPVRSLNTLPGVRVGDVKADVHIQGGSPGEHQFLLDGGLIFEPVHLFGLLGATSPFALERITVDKAGFAASKGSYLAGVINAEHLLTDSNEHPFDVQVDPLSLNARLNVSAGVPDGVRADFMAALRKSDWNGPLSNIRSSRIDNLLLAWNNPDPFLLRASLFPLYRLNPFRYNLLVQRLDSIPPPDIPELGFSDLHLAGRVHFPNGNTYHASYYRGSNDLLGRRLVTAFDSTMQDVSNPPDRYDWINENAQFRWSFLLASKLFATMRVRSSFYRLNHEYSGLDRQNAILLSDVGRLVIDLGAADDGNRIQEIAFESTMDYDHWGGYLQTGFEVIRSRHRFTISDAFPRRIVHEDSTWRAAFFAEDRLDITSRLALTGGTRLTYLGSRATLYAEPRLEIQYHPFDFLSVRGAGGLYRQYLNQFDVSTISPSTLFPSIRFWMPVDSSIAPPKAYHAAADLVLGFAEGWTFRVEGYYKDQQRLLRIDYPSLWRNRQDAGDTLITSQGEFIKPAKGYAYGSAFVLERAGTTLRTSVRYEYNVAKREYAFRDSIRVQPVPWSEPHRLEVALDWTPHPRFIATARWRGGWGRIWGFRRAYYDFLGTDVAQALSFEEYDFRHPSDHTLPAFQQLDLGAAYTQPLGPVALQLRLDLLNATDRQNVADRSLEEEIEGDELKLQRHERYLLSRTLSVSVRLTW